MINETDRDEPGIQSTPGDVELNNVAFQNPDGSFVFVAVNTTETARPISLAIQSKAFEYKAPAKSISTCVWKL